MTEDDPADVPLLVRQLAEREWLLGVSATMTQRCTQLDIEVLTREVQRLPGVEATWAALDPEDRVAFRAEWHDLMDVFVHLVAAYEAGRLAAREVSALDSLVAALMVVLPTMERMRLRQPDPDTLTRMRLAAAS